MTLLGPSDIPPARATELAAVDVAGDAVFGEQVEEALVGAAEELLRRSIHAAVMLHRMGRPVSPEGIAGFDPLVPRDQASLIVRSQRFRASMQEQGIEMFYRNELSPEQRAFVAIYWNPDVLPLSHAQKLRTAGVSQAKFLNWLKQPVFASEWTQISEDVTAASQAIAQMRLAEATDQGKRWAVLTTLAVTNRYDPGSKESEMYQILMMVLGVLDQELVGHQGILEKIGRRVEDLIPGLQNGLASAREVLTVASQAELPAAPTVQEAPFPGFPPLADILADDPPESVPGDSMSGGWAIDLSKPNRNRPEL